MADVAPGRCTASKARVIPVILLTLLVLVLLTLNHWLLETLTGWGESLLELRLLPWLALGVGAWLLAGRRD